MEYIIVFAVVFVIVLIFYKNSPIKSLLLNRAFATSSTIDALPINDNYVVLSCQKVTSWIGDEYSGYKKDNLLVVLLHPKGSIFWHNTSKGHAPRRIFVLLLNNYGVEKMLEPGQALAVVNVNGEKALEVNQSFGVYRISS